MRPLTAAILLLAACGTTPKPVDFEPAERLIKSGRIGEAIVALSKLAHELQGRPARESQDEFDLASLYSRLFELRAGEYAAAHPDIVSQAPALAPALADPAGGSFLALTLRHDIGVLTGPASPELRTKSLARVVGILLLKAERENLRKSSLPDEPLLHTLLLLEAAVSFEHAFLKAVPTADRGRLKRIFERMAAVVEALEKAPATIETFRGVWKKLAEDQRDRADGAEKDATPAPLADELRKVADYSLKRHLEEAIRWSDRGTQEKAARGKAEEIERCYRASLRHFIFARESLLLPDMQEETQLSTIPIVLKFWRDVTR